MISPKTFTWLPPLLFFYPLTLLSLNLCRSLADISHHRPYGLYGRNPLEHATDWIWWRNTEIPCAIFQRDREWAELPTTVPCSKWCGEGEASRNECYEPVVTAWRIWCIMRKRSGIEGVWDQWLGSPFKALHAALLHRASCFTRTYMSTMYLVDNVFFSKRSLSMRSVFLQHESINSVPFPNATEADINASPGGPLGNLYTLSGPFEPVLCWDYLVSLLRHGDATKRHLCWNVPHERTDSRNHRRRRLSRGRAIYTFNVVT